MEFGYFYDQTLLEDDDLRAFVPYDASGGSGNFMANGSETGTTPGVFYTLTGTRNLTDFTAILTYTKENLARVGPTGNDGAMKLMSNLAENTGGWTFGIDNANFLFIYSHYPNYCAYTFDEITLGKKNCIALQKQGQNFSVHNYSPYSEHIEESQTVTFEPYSLLSGGDIKMGSDGYPNNQFLPGVAYFRGTMDQYAVIDSAVDGQTLNTLLSGFSPYTLVNNSTTGTELISSSFVFPTGSPPQVDLNFMSGVASGYAQSVFNELVPAPGIYEGKFESNLNGPNNYFIQPLIGNESFCSTQFDSFGGGFDVAYTGSSKAGTGNTFFSLNESGQYSFQFLFSPLYNVTLNQVYQTGVVTNNYSFVLDSGYYTGFYLYGVAETNGITTLLASLDNRTGLVGEEGIFDASTGLFKLPTAASGQIFWFDGLPYSGAVYYKNNSYVDIPDYVENSSDYVIYDSPGNNLSYESLAINNFATGEFHLSKSVVFTGFNSVGPMYRISEKQYVETHPLHLYHAKNVVEVTGVNLYNNNNQYWTT